MHDAGQAPLPRRGWRDRVRSARRAAVAGAGATAAMTVAMAVMRPATRDDLGPRQVTGWLIGRVAPEHVGDHAPLLPSMINHVAYGSALGALYGVLVPPERACRRSGIGYGLLVWASNYGGLLPALGVLPPPQRDVTSHAVRLHLVHWVYGAVLGHLYGRRD